MLASRPHEISIAHANLFLTLAFSHYIYLGTSEFYTGTGPGMPGCSYATRSMHGYMWYSALGRPRPVTKLHVVPLSRCPRCNS